MLKIYSKYIYSSNLDEYLNNCGKQRTLCGNFKAYDVDCSSFVKDAHLECRYDSH